MDHQFNYCFHFFGRIFGQKTYIVWYNVLMDNGQHRQDVNNPFSGITTGIGNASERANPLTSEENLNQDDFVNNDHNYGSMGNTAINNAPRLADSDIALSMPPGTPDEENQLGQIVDLSTAPSTKAPQQPINESPESEQGDDPAIDAHFGDGKINKDDVSYIKSKERELEPEQLVEFVMKARARMVGKETNE